MKKYFSLSEKALIRNFTETIKYLTEDYKCKRTSLRKMIAMQIVKLGVDNNTKITTIQIRCQL